MQDFIREVDPDIIIGYNICKFDLPYLIQVKKFHLSFSVTFTSISFQYATLVDTDH